MISRFSHIQLTALAWLLFVTVLVVSALRVGPRFDSSILSLLPESEQQPVVQMATEQMSEQFSKRLILLLSSDNEAKLRIAVEQLAESMTTLPDVSKIDWQIDEQTLKGVQEQSYPYRFAVLDDVSRKLLRAGNYQQLQDRALLRLFSPLSVGKTNLVEDPFALFTEFSLSRKNELNIQVSNSLIKVIGTKQPTYMLVLTLSGDPFAPEVQQRVLGKLTIQSELLKQEAITLRMSGMLLHAAAGTQQASQEISTIGIGSLIGIIIVMLLVFRQIKPLILMMFPIVIGLLAAASVTLLVFGEVHLITFAFGAGLVGVSIDYALHFLCERQVSSSKHVLDKIFPGLVLGLFSSVMAYAAQALAPFPGLQQMAVFSVAGLIASWITVVVWFPVLTKNSVQQELVLVSYLERLRQYFPHVQGNKVLIIILIIITVLSINSIIASKSLDDIRLLQTSPASLLSQEKEVQQTLGISSSSQFLLINAETIEACLQKEEKIIPMLDALKDKGLLQGYQALSQQLPSAKRQAENISLVKHLYQAQLDSFYDKLHLSDDKLIESKHTLELASMLRLNPEVWMTQTGNEVWRDLIVSDSNSMATIIRFTGSITDESKQALIALSSKDSAIQYVDQVQNISRLMSNYRSEVINLISAAYLLVLFVLVLRYRLSVWRVILPPMLASIFTLAILINVEQGLNLFHLMALILVLGIGVDMGIFLSETAESPHTWLAVSLSTYTSLLAFGLLSLSTTPVLHHFGLTVLIGLIIVMLLALIMRKNKGGLVRV